MQVPRNHFLAGTGLTSNENAHLLVRHLRHQLAHMSDTAAGSHQAPEQLHFPLLATLQSVRVLLPVDLRPVE